MRLVPSRKFTLSAIILSVILSISVVSAEQVSNTAAPFGEDMFVQVTSAPDGGSYSVSLPVADLKNALPLQQNFQSGGAPVTQGAGNLTAQGVSGRLAVFPYGTTSATVTGIQVDGVDLAHTAVEASDVMIMRGIPIVSLTVNHGDFAGIADGSANADIRFAVQGNFSGQNSNSDENPVLSLLRGAARNPDGSMPDNRGMYLIVTSEALQAALTPLIEWKAREGYEVRVVTLTETGPSRNELRAYLQNAYDTWENPPLYVLLAGDANGGADIEVPTYNLSNTVTDHIFTRLDGDDILPDIFIGRLPAQTLNEMSLHVAKTVNYLSVPQIDETDWQKKALTVAVSLNSTTGVPLCSWIRDELMQYGYTVVDTVHDLVFGETGRYGDEMIEETINAGAGFVMYRGWAYGDDGWVSDAGSTPYVSANVHELNNGWRLPVVFSIVCHTGNFGGDCFGESWLNAGNLESPRGGVAFMGTGEHHSHTRWNDRLAIGVSAAVTEHEIHQITPIMVSTKLGLIPQFPTEVHMDDAWLDPEEAVEYYMHTYNVLGDPSLQIWTDVPQVLSVDTATGSLPYESNHLSLTVTGSGSAPIAGAHVSMVQDGEVIGYGVTAADGTLDLPLNFGTMNTASLTITGDNLYPYQDDFTVTQAANALTFSSVIVGGDYVVPGIPSAVMLQAINSGSANISSASVIVTGTDVAPVTQGSTTFGAITAGATATAESDITLWFAEPATEDGTRAGFIMTPTIGGTEATATEFWITASAPAFTCTAVSDGDDDLFFAGDEANLIVTLNNSGSIAAGALSATARSLAPQTAVFVDSICAFDEIAVDATGTNSADPMVIQINATAGPGMVIPIELTLASADGPIAVANVNVLVGRVDFSNPIGPDAYGYYCYDSADLDYPEQAPVYNWVECSTTYGGVGELLIRIRDNKRTQIVDLPFTFRYYGREYTQARVSDNGWITFDLDYWYDVRNWSMPDRWGSASFVAPFWDNLYAVVPEGTDGIYALDDSDNDQYIIEWSRLRNFEQASTDNFQTFEVILRDVPGDTVDDEIIFQYKQIVNDDYTRMYSTVGIEDHTETVGIEYSYANSYHPGAAPLSPGLAIKFTTEAPSYVPLTTTSFTARFTTGAQAPQQQGESGTGVQLDWALSAERSLAGLELYRAVHNGGGWSAEVKVHDGLLAIDTASYTDMTADPDGRYRYRLSATNSYGNSRPLGETVFELNRPDGPFLQLMNGSVVRNEAIIRFSAGGGALKDLAVYDATGRRVIDLLPHVSGGSEIIAWDGRDNYGHLVPSGLYWVRMNSDATQRRTKLMIIR
jgi:Peptidase family C25